LIVQLIVSVGIALVVSGICSIFEAALYSISLTQIEVLAQSGKKSGRLLKSLRADIHKPITAILTLNTIAHTMGAAVAGASAVAVFGEEYLGWFSAIFTLAILLFTEILPKTAGVAYANQLAPWFAHPLRWLVVAMGPLIWLCQVVTRLIPRQTGEALVSAREVRAIAMLSRKAGEIEPDQEMVIANILELRHKTVRQVMTPRTVTFTLSEHLTVGQAMETRSRWQRHSRVPVYDENPDDVVGIVLRQDLLSSFADDEDERRLTDIMHPVHFVPESAPLNRVLVDFLERRQHLFVVVDEYGGVTGVISMEDVLEEIVGREIMDESDQASDMRELARQKRQTLRGG